jgi:archaellum component FlaF (FlaF/FlaG flagellin family)
MAAPARPWRRVATGVAVVLAVAVTLGLVYAAWQNPHLAVDLANAVWSCF